MMPSVLLLLACGETPEQVATPATDVVSLRIEPTTLELETREGAPAEADFVAYATFEDGKETPITLVAWESSSPSAGEIDANGHFTASSVNGGKTLISANHLGIIAEAEVTVYYHDDIVVSGTDEGVVDAFAAASPTTDPALTLRYPEDGVRVPRNLEGLSFLWDTPSDGYVTRLRMSSDLTDISVYTDAESWSASTAEWTTIAAGNQESTVKVQVTVGKWANGTLTDVTAGPEISMVVNRLDVYGSVLYWSTTDEGILRLPIGTTLPSPFWTTTDSGSCIGCHFVSQATDKMVVARQGTAGFFVFSVLDISDPDAPTVLIEGDDNEKTVFSTASPDGKYIAGVGNGALSIYNMETGAKISTQNLGSMVSQPDWAPDGQSLVLTQITENFYNDMGFTGGQIVKVPWDGTNLGSPQILVPADPSYNNYYPAWSPDGVWVAYNRSTGESYFDEDAELWLVSADGNINLRLDNANGATDAMNSYPRWAPLSDDDILWLAWSSNREYPVAGVTNPQIWVSAIDPALASTGQDPSSAAFWLPGQSTTSNNHLPVWWSK